MSLMKQKASIEGVAGGFATGVLSARAQWEAKSRPSVASGEQNQNSIDYDGVQFGSRAQDSSGNATGFEMVTQSRSIITAAFLPA